MGGAVNMVLRNAVFRGVSIFALALACLSCSQAESLPAASPALDDAFLQLRDAARKGNAGLAEDLAQKLAAYPIPSYVDYYRLKSHQRNASDAEIRAFLDKYDGSAIADRVRNDWLLDLGNRRRWNVFDEQYPLFVLKDDTQLKCYALLSRSGKGQNVAAAARELLVAPKEYGDGCVALISNLAANGQFGADDVWAQVRLAVESGAVGNAKRFGAIAGASEKDVARAMELPSLVVIRGPKSGRASHEVYLVALGRMARTSHALAARALQSASSKLSAQEQAQGWAQIALQASLSLSPSAPAYWHKAKGAVLSNDGHQWKVRAALRAGDWAQVRDGVDAMPATLKGDPAWIYWKGRALLAEGKQEQAQKLFASIADQTNFYGQLALEETGHKIAVPESASAPTADEMAAMPANQGFKRAMKFFNLGLRFEGTREWNWELRKMNERELLAAAEFARQSNLLDRMVNTSDRTRKEVNFSQRFPSPYRDQMREATHSLGLDMAWAYGLIRQESRFVLNARSQVGASGLMQLMPATARDVARRIGLRDYSHDQVNDIQTNIVLGTNYLNMVLKDLNGSQPMATAAYNAGPGRPRSWRSSLTRSVEGAIFAETIPFSETRGYVKNVMSNATYYAALFENRPQSLKERLGSVEPKGFIRSLLP